MSIRLMTRIWDSGAYSGGTLLVLLALADFANDDGTRIFPHVETLAKKARLSVRATQLALETLRNDGVLTVVGNTGGGRGKAVEYQMDVERVQKVRPDGKGEVRDGKGCNEQQERVQPATERVQSATSHIDNHQEPSVPVKDTPAASPPGPQAEVVSLFPDLENTPVKAKAKKQLDPGELEAAFALYDQAAEQAGWSAISMRSDTRKVALANRLKELGGIEGWRTAISKALASDFCCGKCPPTPPRTKAFKADFDFLTQQSSLIKLMEGKYDNAKPGEGPGPAGGGGFLEAASRLAARGAAANS